MRLPMSISTWTITTLTRVPTLIQKAAYLTVNNPNIVAQALYIYGNTQDDSVTLDSALIMAYLEIQMGDGADTLTLLNDLQAPVSRFYLGEGEDLLVINTIGDYGYDMIANMGAGNDLVRPLASNTDFTVNGDSGNDFFEIYVNIPFTMTLNGGDDDDTFCFADAVALLGTIDGGLGSDKIDLSDYLTTQVANLTAINISGFAGTFDPAVLDGFSNVDQIFVSAGVLDDTLFGMDEIARWDVNGSASQYTVQTTVLTFGGFDILQGGNQVDTFVLHASENAVLYGNAGNDVFALLDAASLNGTIYGGSGTNLLDYGAYNTPVLVDLVIPFATNITLINSIQNVAGGFADDVLRGDNNVNVLWGNPGADTIYGLGADDVIYGGSGDDLLYGGTGNDRYMYVPGFGSDQVFETSGQGTDVFDFSENLTGLAIDIGTTLVSVGADSIYHAANQVEIVRGGVGDDVFQVLEPRSIALQGGLGDDTFSFFDGIQLTGTADGQAGHDTLDLNAMTTPQQVLLTGLGATDGFTGSTASIIGTFTNMDEVFGSATPGDTLTGMNVPALFDLDGTDQYISTHALDLSGFETLFGGDAADTFHISGTQTYDLLNGGGGNDLFWLSDNAVFNGVMDGAGGTNTLDFSQYLTSRFVLLTGYCSASAFVGEEPSINGSFQNINHLIGTHLTDTLQGVNDDGVFTFMLTGNSYNSGSHWISFESFEDLVGGSGNDAFVFYDGATHTGNLDGADGIDTVDLSRYNSDIYVDLSINFLSVLFSGIYNVENATGGNGNDTLIGDGNDNRLDGGGGDDLIYGLGGNDLLYAGSGDNIMYGGDGDDIFHCGRGFNTMYGGDGFDTAWVWRNTRYIFPWNDVERIKFYPEESQPFYLVIHVRSAEQVPLVCEGYPNCVGLILRLPNGDQAVFWPGSCTHCQLVG